VKGFRKSINRLCGEYRNVGTADKIMLIVFTADYASVCKTVLHTQHKIFAGIFASVFLFYYTCI